MDTGGFIKLYRKIEDHPIMQSPWLCHLWVRCLLKANWKDCRQLIPGTKDQIIVARGSFLTTGSKLHELVYPPADADRREFVAPSARTLWRWLKSLEAMECVKLDDVSSRGTVVSIVNYDIYQSSDKDSDKVVSRRCHAGVTPSLEEEVKKERTCEAEMADDVQIDPLRPLRQDGSSGQREKREPSELDPAWLARMWVDQRKGHKGREELDRARTTFEEMIRLGCSMAEIAAEIMREDRRKTEPVWEFETRLMPKSRHTQQPFSGLKAFVEKGQ